MEEKKPQPNHTEADQKTLSATVETDADKTKDGSHDSNQIADDNHKKSFRRSWRSANPLHKLTLIFTGVLTVSTTIYAIFSVWQLIEIRQGSEDTHVLAEQAKVQATLMRQQLVGTLAAILHPMVEYDPEKVTHLFVVSNEGHQIGRPISIRLEAYERLISKDESIGKPIPLEVGLPPPIQPGHNSNAFYFRIPRPMEEVIKKGWQGGKTITFRGEFRYDNGFGDVWSEKLCYTWVPPFFRKRDNTHVPSVLFECGTLEGILGHPNEFVPEQPDKK
jgi:hypothetical protein